MVIKQGEIYWVNLATPKGSEPGYRHPHIVVQNDVFNTSLINTIVICAITSNIKRASSPGNVLLNKGEANLPKKSVVNISQIFTINKEELAEKIGKVSPQRMSQIIEGIQLLIEKRSIE
jgi:mRNA interferase MazF